jgi:hypothetical protein
VLFRKKSPKEQAIRDGEKAHRKERKAAERALDAARKGEEVAKFKDARLFRDRVEKGNETVPLVPGMRAEVEITGSVRTFQGKLGFFDELKGEQIKSHRLLGPKYGDQVEKTVDDRTVILTIETDRAGIMLTCKPADEAAAREFAQKVRVHAAGGPDAAKARTDAVGAAEQALAELDRHHADAGKTPAPASE